MRPAVAGAEAQRDGILPGTPRRRAGGIMSPLFAPTSGRVTVALAWLTALVTPALLGWAFLVATGAR